MKILNIGILAHVDAGKTSLTERLLYNAGVLTELGSVDKGTTNTDTLDLERKRGITIKTAVTSFTLNDLKINLIDTPGHPDFIAEVERSLTILDAVVLVISAVEGIQPQTKKFIRVLKRLDIPTIIFINKIDRVGTRVKEIEAELRASFKPDVPVYTGSATLNIGISQLMGGLASHFNPTDLSGKELSATIFKIERDKGGQKIVYARIYSGTLTGHKRISWGRTGEDQIYTSKVIALQRFVDGKGVFTPTATAGEIVKIWGLHDCGIGDYLGKPPAHNRQFELTYPNLEIVVNPAPGVSPAKLYKALEEISEQDPFVQIYQDPYDQTLSVRLCGEVQKEVIADTLLNNYHLEITFEESTVICIERPASSGEGLEIGDKAHSYKGAVGISIKPGPVGSGVQYKLTRDVVGKMPKAFYSAIEEAVHNVLHRGIYGWQVTDCIVTLAKVAYWPRQSHAHAHFDKSMSSTAGDFRDELAPRALKKALQNASTNVYEPMNTFELDVPNWAVPQIMIKLIAVGGQIGNSPVSDGRITRITGAIPANTTFKFERQLADLTKGEGLFLSELGEYRYVGKKPPVRK